jgi:hypothetical protein
MHVVCHPDLQLERSLCERANDLIPTLPSKVPTLSSRVFRILLGHLDC